MIHAWISIALFACTPLQAQTRLVPNQLSNHAIDGGVSHEYTFELQANEYARIMAKQHNVDVTLSVFAPDGHPLFEVNNALPSDEENAEMIAEVSGVYRVRVSIPEKAPAGRYDIQLCDIQPAAELHRSRIAAFRVFSEAGSLWRQHNREGLLKALKLFERALPLWRTAQDPAREALTIINLSLAYLELGDQPKGQDYAQRALSAAKAMGDRRWEAWAYYGLGQVQNKFGDKRKAIECYDQALPLMREVGDRVGEGDILNMAGTAYAGIGENPKALELFESAKVIFTAIQDRSRLATLAGNIGVTYDSLGEYARALDNLNYELKLQREIPNRVGEAITLNNLGVVYSNLGDYQKGLDSYRAALAIHRSLERKWDVAINLHNIGWVYSTLGERQQSLAAYEEALQILRTVKDQWGLANTINNLAEMYVELGDHRKALQFHEEALAIRRGVGDANRIAVSLHNLGKLYAKLNRTDEARDYFEQALRIVNSTGNQRQLGTVHRNFGNFYRDAGDLAQAREHLEEALRISCLIHDRRGEADNLSALARLSRAENDFARAHEYAERALSRFEELRLSVSSPRLRASFFASARDVHELNVEALMRLHREHPEAALDITAFLASERGRARSLMELLTESSVEIRQGVDAALLAKERELQQRIAGKAERQTRLLNGKHTSSDAIAAKKELDLLAAELEQVQSKIRETSPRYASLVQPEPPRLVDIQTKVLDDDTVLLEYALGVEKSFLWVVTKSSVYSFELPARAALESSARRVYELIINRKGEAYRAASIELSKTLLGPAASCIRNKRLLIVAEGVLQYLPFTALPDPTLAGSPLVVNHEIITAPSAGVMAILRKEAGSRKAADRGLAVLADPVFNNSDARVVPGEAPRSAANAPDFVRLRFSRSEAEQIARLVPGSNTLKALDFDANRAAVLHPDFGRHRIIHFATHSVINNEQPELSGIVLSLVDRAGKSQNGFLRLYDIYNLRLQSDLVVLSACQTALGGEIKGEGLIGLTRGFLYAGVPRVIASMWEVDDRSTAELMKHFYRQMLVQGETPAAALRSAQIAMWKAKGWEDPYYWAAFTHLGEWR